MGILPDWLGEGEFITVSGNPAPDVDGLEYAPRPSEITGLEYQ